MVPYHILICKTFPRCDISNALLPVIVRLLVVSTKFLFRTANIVLTSRRAAEQAGNAKELDTENQYRDGGLLYLLTRKFTVYWAKLLKVEMLCKFRFIRHRFLKKWRSSVYENDLHRWNSLRWIVIDSLYLFIEKYSCNTYLTI